MKGLVYRSLGVCLAVTACLAAVVGTLVVVAEYAAFVPLLILLLLSISAAWKWVRGDWG